MLINDEKALDKLIVTSYLQYPDQLVRVSVYIGSKLFKTIELKLCRCPELSKIYQAVLGALFSNKGREIKVYIKPILEE